jgi:hypothetical protein
VTRKLSAQISELEFVRGQGLVSGGFFAGERLSLFLQVFNFRGKLLGLLCRSPVAGQCNEGQIKRSLRDQGFDPAAAGKRLDVAAYSSQLAALRKASCDRERGEHKLSALRAGPEWV